MENSHTVPETGCDTALPQGQHRSVRAKSQDDLGPQGSRGKLCLFKQCAARFPELSFIPSEVNHRWWVCISQGGYKLWPFASLRLSGNSAALLNCAKGNLLVRDATVCSFSATISAIAEQWVFYLLEGEKKMGRNLWNSHFYQLVLRLQNLQSQK